MSHPIARILREEGRLQTWLARRIEYNAEHVNRVIHGVVSASPDFRRRCAEVLGMDEGALFDLGGDHADDSCGDARSDVAAAS